MKQEKRIPFGRVLEARLGQVLRDAGFELIEHQHRPREVLYFERRGTESNESDNITFQGLEPGWPNTIMIQPSTSIANRVGLKTIKELLPNYGSIPIELTDRWEYQSKEELEAVFDEIVPLVTGPLFDWFKNPVFNPAGLDMTPRHLYTDEENIARIKLRIRNKELELQRVMETGDPRAIERVRFLLEDHKRALAVLEAKKP